MVVFVRLAHVFLMWIGWARVRSRQSLGSGAAANQAARSGKQEHRESKQAELDSLRNADPGVGVAGASSKSIWSVDMQVMNSGNLSSHSDPRDNQHSPTIEATEVTVKFPPKGNGVSER
eukprot:gb/GEZN01027042.1/.p1 GENE.gb/GEZN01027042.1/~~gb/GEZN01027042.1/.p1  ORF type:complete len:133 (+),score=12.71 gb/GEZN01027042.1/:43-399(+)